LDTGRVVYLEAHGTGTAVGDKQELFSISSAFSTPSRVTSSDGKKREGALTIGSIKSNVGHLEFGAAGAGIMKVGISLE